MISGLFTYTEVRIPGVLYSHSADHSYEQCLHDRTDLRIQKSFKNTIFFSYYYLLTCENYREINNFRIRTPF